MESRGPGATGSLHWPTGKGARQRPGKHFACEEEEGELAPEALGLGSRLHPEHPGGSPGGPCPSLHLRRGFGSRVPEEEDTPWPHGLVTAT